MLIKFKKIFSKNGQPYNGFEAFNGLDDFMSFQKLRNLTKKERQGQFSKIKDKVNFTEVIKEELLNSNKISEKKYSMVKGADEINSIVGSVAGLAILAPQVSHVTIHPIMRFLGMEKDNHSQKSEQKLDKKA